MATSKKPEDHAPQTSRRRFLFGLWAVLGALFLVEFFWIVADFLRPRKRPRKGKASVIVAGPVERFEKETVTAFPAGAFYLVRLADGGFLAVSRECTHLGCTVAWDAQKDRFRCPCHASVYDISGGVLQPPAPRPLDTFAVHIENRMVKVDTSVRTKRSTSTPDQETMS